MDRFFLDSISLVGAPSVVGGEREWRWETRLPHYYFNFFYFLEGRGELWADGKYCLLEPGVACLLPPGTVIRDGRSPEKQPAVNFYLHFWPKPDSAKSQLTDHCYRPIRVRNPGLMREMVEHCAAIFQRPESGALHRIGVDYARLVLEQFFLDSDGKQGDAVDEEIYAIGYQIEYDPAHDWTIDDIAKRLGLSRAHTHERFRDALNMTPSQFVIQSRVKRASYLLDNSSQTVQEIADELGYRDVYFFSRQFKQKTGVSPLAYRRRA